MNDAGRNLRKNHTKAIYASIVIEVCANLIMMIFELIGGLPETNVRVISASKYVQWGYTQVLGWMMNGYSSYEVFFPMC